MEFVFHGRNAAWFNALKGDRAEMIDWVKRTLVEAEAHRDLEQLMLEYFRTAADFDKYRGAPEFAALLNR